MPATLFGLLLAFALGLTVVTVLLPILITKVFAKLMLGRMPAALHIAAC